MNLESFPLLSIIIFLPLFGALFVSFVNQEEMQDNAKYVTLWTSLVTLFLTLVLSSTFNPFGPSFQWINCVRLSSTWMLEYKVGIDGLSLGCMLLTTIIFPLAIWASWDSIKTNLKLYSSLILALEFFVLHTFCSLNLLSFFIGFESCLFPLYFFIGLWGGENKIQAALTFFLYNFLGSIFFLVAIFLTGFEANTFDLPALLKTSFSIPFQATVGLFFMAGLLIKLPCFPFHSWLPLAHVQAPTSISMILSGVILNLSVYSTLRFLPIFLSGFLSLYSSYVIWINVLTLIYVSWLVSVEKDIKKIIAYVSISHMNLIFIGISLGSKESLTGAFCHLISHGFISAALFFSIGILYDKVHSRDIDNFGGLVRKMPYFTGLFFLLAMGMLGVPGTSGFVGEFLIFFSAIPQHIFLAIGLAFSFFLCAIYSIRLFSKIFFNMVTGTLVLGLKDLNIREKSILIIFICLIFVIGIVPQPLIKLAYHVFHNKISSVGFLS